MIKIVDMSERDLAVMEAVYPGYRTRNPEVRFIAKKWDYDDWAEKKREATRRQRRKNERN